MYLLDIDHIFDISTFRDPVGKYLFKVNKKDTTKMSIDILMWNWKNYLPKRDVILIISHNFFLKSLKRRIFSTQFWPMFAFYTHMKTSENQRLSFLVFLGSVK